MSKTTFTLAWILAGCMTTIAAAAPAPEPPQSPPSPRSRAEVEAVLAKAPAAPAGSPLRPLKIILVADEKDHGSDAHDYPLWQKRWRVLLGGAASADAERQVNLYGPPGPGDPKVVLAGAPQVTVATAWKWPSPEQLPTADLIVMHCYRTGGAHWQWDAQRPKDLDAFLARGGGFVAIHPATFMLVDFALPEWKPLRELTGLAFGKGNLTRRGPLEIRLDTNHPICRGLPETIRLIDEPFWPVFGDLEAVEVLGTSQETIAPDSSQTRPQPMFWTYRRGKGRVFGCVPGHFTWTFDDPLFRLLLLRGMAWAAGESPYRFDGLALRGVSLRDETTRTSAGQEVNSRP